MAHSALTQQLRQLLIQARNRNLRAAGREPVAPNPARRRFLRNSALGGTALLAAGALPGCWASKPSRIAIIGAGLAGLNAAYQLGKVGLKADIFEASGRAGGRVLTAHGRLGAGLDTDLGGELVNTDHSDMLALVEDFGLTLTNRLEPHPELDKVAFYYCGRKRSEAEMAEALRPFAAQMMADSEQLDADWDTWAPVFDNLSLTQYLDMHAAMLTHDPDIRGLMEAAVRVEYGVEPEDSSALQLLFLLPVAEGDHIDVLSTSDEAFVINGGSETVVQGLRTALADQIHLQQGLQSLRKAGNRFRLGFHNDTGQEFDYVILALPFTALRSVEMDLPLPKSLQRFIQEVDLGRNEKVIAGVGERVWRQAAGFEVEAWNDQTVSLLWDASLRQPELADGALTFFISSREVDTTATGTATEQGQALLAEYNHLLPGLSQAGNGKFLRTAWHKQPYIRGGYTNFKPGQYTELAEEWLYIEAEDPSEGQDFALGNLVFAGEHTSDEYYGFMNGAAQSGRLAAQYIVRRLLKVE